MREPAVLTDVLQASEENQSVLYLAVSFRGQVNHARTAAYCHCVVGICYPMFIYDSIWLICMDLCMVLHIM